MNKEEYIKFVKENEEMSRFVEIAAQLKTIEYYLIENNLCNASDFNRTKEYFSKKIIEAKYEAENKEDLEKAKKINDFFKMFGVE